MKVILEKSVPKLGNRGEAVEVSFGYARNYLIPKGLAVAATAGAQKNAQLLSSKIDKAKKEIKAQAADIKKEISGKKVEITAKAAEKGQLFAAVNPEQIATVIAKTSDYKIPSDNIVIEDEIKKIGEHEALIKITPETEFKIIVNVSPEESQ